MDGRGESGPPTTERAGAVTRTHVGRQADALDSVGLAKSLLEEKKKAVREEAAGPRRPGLAVVFKGLFLPAMRLSSPRLSSPRLVALLRAYLCLLSPGASCFVYTLYQVLAFHQHAPETSARIRRAMQHHRPAIDPALIIRSPVSWPPALLKHARPAAGLSPPLPHAQPMAQAPRDCPHTTCERLQIPACSETGHSQCYIQRLKTRFCSALSRHFTSNAAVEQAQPGRHQATPR